MCPSICEYRNSTSANRGGSIKDKAIPRAVQKPSLDMSSSWLLFSWHVLLSFLLLSSHLSPSHLLSSLFWAFSQLFSIYLSSSNLGSPQLFSSEPSLSPAQLTSSYLSPFQLFSALLFWASSQPCSTYLSLSLLISALCQLFSSLFSIPVGTKTWGTVLEKNRSKMMTPNLWERF